MEGAFCLLFVHGFVHGRSRGSALVDPIALVLRDLCQGGGAPPRPDAPAPGVRPGGRSRRSAPGRRSSDSRSTVTAGPHARVQTAQG
jgi:hypothetical protein